MKIEHFRKKLEEQKAKLEHEMGSVGRRNPAVPNDWELSPLEDISAESDQADQADIIMKQENDSAILADLEARYDNIIAALERIEKKTYGKCEVCKKEISEERLEADPAATTCVLHL